MDRKKVSSMKEGFFSCLVTDGTHRTGLMTVYIAGV